MYMTKSPRIFIDAGGWYLAYYLGMWEYILAEFGKEAFKGVHFDGISAGGHTAAYIVSAIYGDHTMKHWLENGPKYAVYIHKYGCGQMTEGLYEAGYHFHISLNKAQIRANKKYVRAYCMTDEQELHCCQKIATSEEHAAAASATGNIPIAGACEPMQFRDKQLWDGFFYKQYGNVLDTTNMLYLTFEPHFQCNNTLDLSKWIFYSQLVSLIPSFFPKIASLRICDELFERGFNDAKRNRATLVAKFNAIGIGVI
jgi:hypothetical protein